ncbi:MAG: 3'(2'),5'-bisphosphate nucleotidase CysQ [Proteobacteria bacterium]|nr:3'(2'),5'-bisphosphate nucleotidase CysQ [Pseudomonadota bacterium]
MTKIADWALHAYALAKKAGETIMTYYAYDKEILTEYKEDNSPLTAADKAAHDIIYHGLEHFVLDENGPAPILSEEGKQVLFDERRTWQRYWCVDPLDGTREFLARNDEFAVNIALIAHHQPIIGVIYAPVQKRGYVAWHGGGAYQYDLSGSQRILTTTSCQNPLRLLLSHHCQDIQLQPLLANLGEVSIQYQGSALKFAKLASGEADLMLRLGSTSEWDNAAGHCLIKEAGGLIISLTGHPLEYNCSGSLKQGSFLVAGDSDINWLQKLHKISS